MNTNEVLKLALEFDKRFTSLNGVDVPERVSVPRDEWRDLLNALREALAEQPANQVDDIDVVDIAAQQEPLTDEHIERIYHRYGGDMINCARAIERAAQRTWVGLTDDEIVECWARPTMWAITHAIECKLKEKNT